jgi:hypothetical protein
MSERPPAAERLRNPHAVLFRSDLRELGYPRRAIDSIFASCPVEQVPGYSRPAILVRDFLELRERSTYCGDRVRPCRQPEAMR